MDKLSYLIYATLLDSYTNYLKSDEIWEKYWGNSDNPPHTPEEFKEQQFQSLIDRINRVPFDSEAADKGTAFNEVVDCMIEFRQSEKVQVERVKANNILYGLKVKYNNREFLFPIDICREFADYYKDATPQVKVEGVLPTRYGNVLLYGYIDELMPLSVHDIKTTGKYWYGKFKDHWQHYVYPYCLIQSGNNVTAFEYNITDFKDIWTERYNFEPERDIPILRDHVEEFINFLEYNKHLITDKKIFNNG